MMKDMNFATVSSSLRRNPPSIDVLKSPFGLDSFGRDAVGS